MAADDTSTPQPRTGGYCSWHAMYSRTSVIVRIPPDEGTVGAPALMACLPCRRAYDLVPLSEQTP